MLFHLRSSYSSFSVVTLLPPKKRNKTNGEEGKQKSEGERFVKYMRIIIFVATAFLSFAGLGNAQTAPAPKVFTEKDREFALKYANDTREDFVKQLTGLSDAQLNFRAAEGRWTIGEIAEHIIVVETALFGLITGQIMKSAPPKCEDVFRMGDRAIILTVTNRSEKFQAPEQVRPNGRWKTREDLLLNFEKARNQTIEF